MTDLLTGLDVLAIFSHPDDAELTVAGRPAILVPLPSAMDDHQTYNAHEMAAEGGARAIPQSQFTPERLSTEIMRLTGDPEALIAAAAHAKKCGRPLATEDLADLKRRRTRPAPFGAGQFQRSVAGGHDEGRNRKDFTRPPTLASGSG